MNQSTSIWVPAGQRFFRVLCIALVWFSMWFTAGKAQACFHYPMSFQGEIVNSFQDVFLMQTGETQHWVIRSQLDAKKFPREIAWVLPVPALPLRSEVISGPFFEELYGLVAPTSQTDAFGRIAEGAGKSRTSTISISPVRHLDQYEIQTIEILKDQKSNEFDLWLRKNHFNSMPSAQQRIYLKKGAVFLAIRMKMNHPTEGKLIAKPLHLVFKATGLRFPIRLTHTHRQLNIRVTVFSEKKESQDMAAWYFHPAAVAPYTNRGLSPFLDELIGKQEGYLVLYEGLGLNQKDKPLARLDSDPLFK